MLTGKDGNAIDHQKSWKKINEERKALKKKRKQEKLLKQIKFEELKNVKDISSPKEPKPVPSTISIAVPGSILENAQSAELRSYVAGQIARAACVFRVNEVIVFDDIGIATARKTKCNYAAELDDSEEKTVRSSSLHLARILQYLECPQYLRKFFFPLHKDLKYCGLLNPLDAPHHLRQQNVFPYREGIVTEKPAKAGHCFVNVGLLNDVLVDSAVEPGVRVTVKMGNPTDQHRKVRGTLVSPDEPRRETGVYWGYSVRVAHSISDVFTKSPYEGGYDVTVGTSDRGASIHEVSPKSLNFNHLLIVFGGLSGLEEALASDDKLAIDDPRLLFDHYINVLPKQGSRTIRTEEAILIAMSAFQEKLQPQVEDVAEDLKTLLPQSDCMGGAKTMANDVQSNGEKLNKKKRSSEDNETHFKKSKHHKKIQSQLPSESNGYKESDDFEIVPADNVT